MSSTAPSRAAIGTLTVSSAGLLGLAIYQWVELISVRAGHQTACSVNEVVNCATVWNSPFSHLVQNYLGMPVAGLGVLWGAVALVLSFFITQKPDIFVNAVKVWALLGLLSCVTFISASAQAGALCLTCLGTYVLTAVYAVGALKLLGSPAIPSGSGLVVGLGWSLVLAVPLFLGLLYPGSKTPKEAAALPEVKPEQKGDLAAMIDSLPPEEAEGTSWARNEWRKSATVDSSMFPVHVKKGPDGAPVRIVEFTDIMCPHCAQFENLMGQIETMAPAGSFTQEPRYYPLDSECNPNVPVTSHDGVRCYGAKLQICTEQLPKYFELRRELFANQRQLHQGVMLAIALRFGADSDALQACIKAPETTARLNEDIAYAMKANIEGTPLVLLNGKTAPPAPVFLLGMIQTGGDVDAPAFAKLPPPPLAP